MLENPRNVEFDVYVMDDVFPEDEHSDFLKLIRELNGDWKPRIDDLDVFWFDWEEEHPGRKYLMHLLDIVGKNFDLSSTIDFIEANSCLTFSVLFVFSIGFSFEVEGKTHF